MKGQWKYTREQKVTLTVLACLVMAIIIADTLLTRTKHYNGNAGFTPDSATLARIASFESGIDSIHHYTAPQSKKRTDTNFRNSWQPSSYVDTTLFDKREQNEFTHFAGRRKGLEYREADDRQRRDTSRISSHDRTFYKPKEYFPFELNSADTTLLKRLPGIGSRRAAMITAYRDRLGGYHSPKQLCEIELIPDSIATALLPYIAIKTDSIKRIKVNSSGIDRLRRHPYINYYQAREMHDLRWNATHMGVLHPADMDKIKAFSPEELERLMPYLDFSTAANDTVGKKVQKQ